MRRVALLVLFFAGCDAQFTDLRPAGSSGLDSPADGGGTPGSEVMIARGEFIGRAGHNGTGDVELYRFDNGSLELRFGGNFVVSGAPGPVVIASDREALGSSLDMDRDVVLGRLSAPNGAQVYATPVDHRVVWVWCQPFRVEIARAVLTEVQ